MNHPNLTKVDPMQFTAIGKSDETDPMQILAKPFTNPSRSL